MAYDHGDPSTNTTTILAVTVLDINDNPPVIFDGPYLTANVSEVGLRCLVNQERLKLFRPLCGFYFFFAFEMVDSFQLHASSKLSW